MTSSGVSAKGVSEWIAKACVKGDAKDCLKSGAKGGAMACSERVERPGSEHDERHDSAGCAAGTAPAASC